ncbi:Phosphoglycerate/bisphosphoglycerate mutase family protein [Heracleum sosnowskyi]|uniref:Phosphoglycerate/bisphosphoglycerate mutase family protein n=1 Tax=Heracleum sosnowskyi TaxID=360622 RepID=A0AAD8J370_9APIA|nr:Phosphoglycerate/bisphosphoglycerate mutase family protein [Heracleum sosnowskyi]
MRDIASCFSEYATEVVSDASCSTFTNHSCSLIPSLQIAVTCLYKTILSNHKPLWITVTWCKNNLSQGLNISFGDDSSTTFKLNPNSRIFRRKKGNKFIQLNNSKCEIIWDLSAAQYKTGPEPVQGYYILIMVDSELGLILGDMAQEVAARKIKNGTHLAKFTLVSRKEHYSGNTHYSTKARFCETGNSHDIVIRCSGVNDGLKYPVLSVCIDKKTVIRIKRLHLNFRGNQSIFVDGLMVDLFWDVHDLFFNPASGSAVFMFKTRSAMDSRLWLQEKMMHKDVQEKLEFCLLIYACNSR